MLLYSCWHAVQLLAVRTASNPPPEDPSCYPPSRPPFLESPADLFATILLTTANSCHYNHSCHPSSHPPATNRRPILATTPPVAPPAARLCVHPSTRRPRILPAGGKPEGGSSPTLECFFGNCSAPAPLLCRLVDHGVLKVRASMSALNVTQDCTAVLNFEVPESPPRFGPER